LVGNYNKFVGIKAALPVGIAVGAMGFAFFIASQISQVNLSDFSALLLIAVCMVPLLLAVLFILKEFGSASPSCPTAEVSRSELIEILDNLPIGVCTIEKGKLSYTNTAWKELAGSPHEGRELFSEAESDSGSSIHRDDRQRVLELFKHSAEDKTEQCIDFRLDHGFSESHIEAHIRTLTNEGARADQIAYLLDVTRSFEYEQELKEKNYSVEAGNEMLRRVVLDLEKNLQAMVQSLVKAVEAKDPYTAGHSERVMAYALWIGEAMQLSQKDLRTLRMGCLIHDVGKIGIRDSILTKPSSLTPAEFFEVQTHPELGARMVESIPLFQECLPIIRNHHEKLDGTGYPKKLGGEEITLLVRIASVADGFDAMTSTRAYRDGMLPEQALAELQKDVLKGTLDPDVVKIFSEVIDREGLLWIPVSQAA